MGTTTEGPMTTRRLVLAGMSAVLLSGCSAQPTARATPPADVSAVQPAGSGATPVVPPARPGGVGRAPGGGRRDRGGCAGRPNSAASRTAIDLTRRAASEAGRDAV